MTFKNIEKDIIRAIVRYKDNATSLADMLNKSHLLEKQGLAIVLKDDHRKFLFYHRDKYDWEDEQKARGRLAEILSFIEKLYTERLLVAFPSSDNRPLVIGKENVTRHRIDVNTVNNGEEYIILYDMGFDWVDKNKQSLYCWCECTDMIRPVENQLFSSYRISQELRDLVKNNFKSEEQVRFEKQQFLTWVSIFVAIFIGLASLIIGVIGLYK